MELNVSEIHNKINIANFCPIRKMLGLHYVPICDNKYHVSSLNISFIYIILQHIIYWLITQYPLKSATLACSSPIITNCYLRWGQYQDLFCALILFILFVAFCALILFILFVAFLVLLSMYYYCITAIKSWIFYLYEYQGTKCYKQNEQYQGTKCYKQNEQYQGTKCYKQNEQYQGTKCYKQNEQYPEY
jgi:hypothetical protein